MILTDKLRLLRLISEQPFEEQEAEVEITEPAEIDDSSEESVVIEEETNENKNIED